MGFGPSASILSPVATISRFHEVIFHVPKSAAVSPIGVPLELFCVPPVYSMRTPATNVRFGSFASVWQRLGYVRFTPGPWPPNQKGPALAGPCDAFHGATSILRQPSKPKEPRPLRK